MRTTPLVGEKPWFGPRRRGWGLSPMSWQGWALVGVFLAIVFLKGTSPGGPRAWAALRQAQSD